MSPVSVRKCALPASVLALFLIVSNGGGATQPETALDILDAPVSYRARFDVQAGHGLFHGQVWHEPGRERRDFDAVGGTQAVLLRRDQDAAYLLNPSGRWAVAFGLHAVAQFAGGIDDMTLERKRIGVGKIDGREGIHYGVKAATADGRAFAGDWWVDHHGVTLKLTGVETEPGGKQTDVLLNQTNITEGSVDAGQLAPPKGYLTFDLRKITAERLVQAMQSLAPLLGGGLHQ